MGNWLFKDNSSSSSKQIDEYQKTIQTLAQQEEELYKAAQSVENQRKELLAKALNRQQETTAKHLQELTDFSIKLTKSHERQKLLYIHATSLISLIYYNYQCGNVRNISPEERRY